MLSFLRQKQRPLPAAPARPLPSLSASSLVGWQAAQNELPAAGLLNALCSGSEMAQEQLTCTASGGGGATPPPPAAALDFPCVLRPAARPAGIGLHLQLFHLRVGEPWELAGASRRAAAVVAAAPPPQRHEKQQQPLLAVADKALCLLAARLLFPDSVAPVLQKLAAAHCASAAIQAIGLLLSPAARTAARRRLQRLCAHAPLAEAAAQGARQLGGLAQRYGEPAALLLAAAALWAYLHPGSAQIGECIAALVPVLAGYNQTAAQCARLGLSGEAAEELWRQRHKWAARRTAGLLSDLPERPPLGGVVSCLEGLNIRIAAVVGGLHFGSFDGAGPGGLQLRGSVGVRSRRSRQRGREALRVAPGHVAAVPAPPLGREASSSVGGEDAEAAILLRQLSQHDMVRHLAQQAEAAAAATGVTAGTGAGAAAASGGSWDEARQQWLAGADPAPAHRQGSCGRGAVLDSPSEMCSSPQAAEWAAPQQAQQVQQAHQDDRGNSTSWATADAGSQAAQREAVAAPGTASVDDFMHPSHWAAVRQQQAGGPACHRARSGSTASQEGSATSVHSFLLPGRQFSSEDESEAGSEEPRLARAASLALPPGVAAAAMPTAASPLGGGMQLPEEPGGQAAALQAAAAGPTAPTAAAVYTALPAQAGAEAAAGVEADAALPLFGRGDHQAAAARPLSATERLQLVLRAGQLLALFLPFVLLGSAMLLLAARLESAAARRQRQRGAQQPQQQGQLEQEGEVVEQEMEDGPAAAGAGAQLAAPAVAEAPFSEAARRLRTGAFKLLLGACRRSGAAFIKWGQWASTREDIFPQDFCRVLSELHDRAPVHSERETRRLVESALGGPLEQLFLSFESRPLASGSIAQVHRARMLVEGRPQEVAVKVRHPGVAKRIWQDFQLLRPLAALTGRVRSLRSLNLSDSVAQFSSTMTAQADLRVEAEHLRRFYANFRGVTSCVHVPRPLEGYCTREVLVETFEPGRSVAHFIRTPHPQNTQIVALGVDTYLKMLLQDNFVHTDLHPGNILVRPAHASARGAQQQQEDAAGSNGGSTSDGSSTSAGGSLQRREQLELVLLDFGLAQELTPAVRHHFVSFLHMISRGDGRAAAHHLLRWAERQRCPDPEAFIADMEALFRERCDMRCPAGIDLDAVIKAVLRLARRHEVSIDSNYAELVIGVCVIVGFATSLDPRLNLMDAATPCFLYHALTGRVSGRLYM
ncbi:hypothetical protein ABPG75_011499 [Micractinium tetrahymenae]